MIEDKLDEILSVVNFIKNFSESYEHSKNIFGIEEASEYTGYSVGYLYKLTSTNSIPFSKPNGKKIYFSREDLDLWLMSNKKRSNKQIDDLASSFITKRKY